MSFSGFPLKANASVEATACAYAVESLTAFFEGIAIQGIINPVTPSLVAYKACALQHAQVLRDRRLRYPQSLCEDIYAQRLLFQKLDDLYPLVDGQNFEQFGRILHQIPSVLLF